MTPSDIRKDLPEHLKQAAGVRSDGDAHLMALAAARISQLEAQIEAWSEIGAEIFASVLMPNELEDKLAATLNSEGQQ